MVATADSKLDLWWVVGFLGLFFLLWLTGGGPERVPPGASGLPAATSTASPARFSESPSSSAAAPSLESPFKGKVRLNQGNARSEIQSNREYITVFFNGQAGETVNLTGFQLVNGKNKRGGRPDQVIIPQATRLFVGGRGIHPLSDVILTPGGRAVIVTGNPPPNSDPFPVNVGFLVNKCSGYLERLPRFDFTPSLASNCPPPRQEPNLVQLSDQCYDFVTRLPSCHTPKFERRSDGYDYVDGRRDTLERSCRDFVKSRFSYNGCVTYHAADSDFYDREWRIFLRQSGELWHNNRETIAFYDPQGRLVDEINY